MRRVFLSPYEFLGNGLLTKDYNGQECEMLGTSTMTTEWEHPEELHDIRFDDGNTAQAFGEELGLVGVLVGTKLWKHPNLSDDTIEKDAPYNTWQEWRDMIVRGLL